MNINKKHRETKQREAILLILQGTRDHPTADGIYDQARQQLPRISKGTIYRNLTVLLGEGKISALNLSGTVTRYELRQRQHYHFRCEQCGRVIDIQRPVDAGLDRKVAGETGLSISYHQMEFRGICHGCQPNKYVKGEACGQFTKR